MLHTYTTNCITLNRIGQTISIGKSGQNLVWEGPTVITNYTFVVVIHAAHSVMAVWLLIMEARFLHMTAIKTAAVKTRAVVVDGGTLNQNTDVTKYISVGVTALY